MPWAEARSLAVDEPGRVAAQGAPHTRGHADSGSPSYRRPIAERLEVNLPQMVAPGGRANGLGYGKVPCAFPELSDGVKENHSDSAQGD